MNEVAYTGYDNAPELQLVRDDVAFTADDYLSVSRYVLKLRDGAGTETVLDSDTVPAVFDASSGDRLVLKVGPQNIAAGRYSAVLIIYDPTHPNGLVFDFFSLRVRDV